MLRKVSHVADSVRSAVVLFSTSIAIKEAMQSLVPVRHCCISHNTTKRSQALLLLRCWGLWDVRSGRAFGRGSSTGFRWHTVLPGARNEHWPAGG